MKRMLFHSEHALLHALLPRESNCDSAELTVVEEYYSPPRTDSKQWFNTDFMIQFASPLPSEFRSEATPIRRHSIGVDIFLVLDRQERPVRVELLGGEGFPKSAFENEILEIARIASIATGDEWLSDIYTALLLRVIDLDAGIIFLASTTTNLHSFKLSEPRRFLDEKHEVYLWKGVDESRMIEGAIRR